METPSNQQNLNDDNKLQQNQHPSKLLEKYKGKLKKISPGAKNRVRGRITVAFFKQRMPFNENQGRECARKLQDFFRREFLHFTMVVSSFVCLFDTEEKGFLLYVAWEKQVNMSSSRFFLPHNAFICEDDALFSLRPELYVFERTVKPSMRAAFLADFTESGLNSALPPHWNDLRNLYTSKVLPTPSPSSQPPIAKTEETILADEFEEAEWDESDIAE